MIHSLYHGYLILTDRQPKFVFIEYCPKVVDFINPKNNTGFLFTTIRMKNRRISNTSIFNTNRVYGIIESKKILENIKSWIEIPYQINITRLSLSFFFHWMRTFLEMNTYIQFRKRLSLLSSFILIEMLVLGLSILAANIIFLFHSQTELLYA